MGDIAFALAGHIFRWELEPQPFGSTHVRNVVVHRENFFEVRFIRKNVDHPRKHMRVESPPRCRASLFRLDRAEHPELRMRALIILYLVCRSRAVINVPMPAPYAERHAL